MRIGYSYLRYSSAQQGDGDSIRRQTALAKAWCDRNNVRLDLTTTFTDHGKSAFRGKHRLKGALCGFLADVEGKRIARGSVLIIESLDRLSREDLYQAMNVFTSIVNAGVSIVTLSPHEKVYEKESNDLPDLINAALEFKRANAESERKEHLSDENWKVKKELARTEQKIMTAAVPAWIAKRDRDVPKVRDKKTGREWQPKTLVLDKNGKMTLDRAKAETVRRIFKMAVAGFSATQIVRKLIADKIPPIARTQWHATYVYKILHGREVLGEMQPRTNGKKPDGAPIPNYYPAVIDEGIWAQAQAAIGGHKKVPGRRGKNVASLFTGMLIDARSRSRMLITWGMSKGALGKYRILLPSDSLPWACRTPRVSFQYQVFETAILGQLKEISPADILGQESEPESAALAAELAIKEQKIREFEEGTFEDVPALVRIVTKLNSEAQDLARRLAIAKQKEAKPQSEAWADAQSLLELATDEDHRTRLRNALRRIVDSIYMLVVPRQTHRLAAVQIFFAGGARRDYLIHLWGAGNGRQSGWRARAIDWAAGEKRRGAVLDLRNQEHVERLEKKLMDIALDQVFEQ